jgi:hypothetical protein
VKFALASAAILLTMTAVMFTSALQESQTWDESTHLAAGYSYWKTGYYGINVEHPPFVKLLCALPLLAWNPDFPRDGPGWREPDQVKLGREFLYHNRFPADMLLAIGRAPVILLTAAFGALMAWWMRREFGPVPGVIALALFAFDPTVVAHGRYVTTDLAVTAFYFLTVAAWFTWLKRGGWAWLAATGIALGLALGSKFSGVLLAPVLALCALTAIRRRRIRVLAAGWAAVCVMGFAILAALYGPATLVAIQFPQENPYFVGFNEVRQHNTGGHPAFLLGQFSEKGWWYYFPVAAALKSTVASIAFVLLALPFVRRGAVLAVAAMCFAAALVLSGLNIGYRHALPVVPLVYALAGIGAAHAIRRWRPAAAIGAVLLAAHAAESLSAYPHYLPFFNIAAGGPSAGPRYLSDSNVDWGQDVKKLRAYLAERNAMEPCISYFGNTPLRYYGIGEHDVPVTDDLEARKNVNCIAAVSVTELQGVYGNPGKYAWLREREPDARIGYSIYVFDLRKR